MGRQHTSGVSYEGGREGREHYLLNVSLSFCAMPRLGLCITTAFGAVAASGGWVIACWLCHDVLLVEKRR